MSEDSEYETGARVLKPATGPDPRDAFSRKAAGNKKPPLGTGLTEKSEQERSEADKSDLRGAGTGGNPEDDALGQSEQNHKGGANDGASSANPRVLSDREEGDATFPLKRPE